MKNVPKELNDHNKEERRNTELEKILPEYCTFNFLSVRSILSGDVGRRIMTWEMQVLLSEYQYIYSKTCPKRPTLGANKSGLCSQVVSIRRYNTLKQCETYNERGDRKEKITKIISNVQNREIYSWSGYFCPGILACCQTLLGNFTKKGSFGSSHGRSTQGKQANGARKNPLLVALGRWSLFTVQFLMKLSVHEKPVVGSRWSLKPGFTVHTVFVVCKWWTDSFG